MSFEQTLHAALAELGANLPEPLWTYIRWLEANGQVHTYAGTNETFLAAIPVAKPEEMTSHLAFETPPDMMRYWLGTEGYDTQIIPFLRCGGDGSYIALWRRGPKDSFVFLGSEGEAFVLAEDPRDLIAIVSMGYSGIEGRDDLSKTPAQIWADGYDQPPWPEPVALKAWAQDTFGIDHQATGAAYLPHDADADPFESFVARIVR